MKQGTHMMFLLLLVTLGTFLSGLPAYGQFSLGIEGGPTYNHLITSIGNRSFTANRSSGGYWAGVILQVDLSKRVSLLADPNLSQKNYSLVRTGPYAGEYESFANNYLQLPVTAKLSWEYKKWTWFVSGGVYGGYWISGVVKGAVPNIFNVTDSTGPNGQTTETFPLSRYREKYSFDAARDQRWEFGLAVGAGFGYRIKKKICLLVEGRYHRSVTDQQKAYMINQSARYNQTMTFLLGMLYSFN